MNTPGIRGRTYRSDMLLAAFEEHLRLGFSVVVVFDDPLFSVTGVSQHTAGVREGTAADLPLAIGRFLERAGDEGMT